MTKQDIIKLIEQVENEIDTSAFSENDGSKTIGCNQFRNLSSLCRKAECCEEIELLIAYKQSKGNGWDSKKENEKQSVGDIIRSKIRIIQDTIYLDDIIETEKQRLEALELFFGYLYWKARIWSSRNNVEFQSENGGECNG